MNKPLKKLSTLFMNGTTLKLKPKSKIKSKKAYLRMFHLCKSMLRKCAE